MTWSQASGQVTACEVDSETDDSGTNYFPRIRYAYEVDGRSYQGGEYAIDPTGWSSKERVEEVIAKYPKGSSITVHYSPSTPKASVLHPGMPWLVISVFLIGMLTFGGFAYLIWRLLLRSGNTRSVGVGSGF